MTTISPAPPRRRGLGVVAFVAAVAAVVLAGAVVWFAGFSLGRILRVTDYLDIVDDAEAQMWESLGRAGWALAILVAGWLLHALLALWALVQGIVATALGRGRGLGIAAIAIACLGWVPLGWWTQESLIAGALGIIPFLG
ncbi:hypothetical protein [Microbacterium indicum]|uniref:hypothetical protein n=1 Tax=Microbacterium indicum TaxID=358100 RepID=UPI00040B8539|nr:hypothetical protein [Microbacterium indicum]